LQILCAFLLPRGEKDLRKTKTFSLSWLDLPLRQCETAKQHKRTIVSDGSEIKGQC
jgi:hypothetical protein